MFSELGKSIKGVNTSQLTEKRLLRRLVSYTKGRDLDMFTYLYFLNFGSLSTDRPRATVISPEFHIRKLQFQLIRPEIDNLGI